MAAIINKRLLDAKAAAAYLSISRSRLYEWSKIEKVKSIKVCGRRMFDILDLDEFIELLKTKQYVQEIEKSLQEMKSKKKSDRIRS